MGVLHDQTAALLGKLLEGRGDTWDEPPALYLLMLHGARRPGLFRMPVDNEVWSCDMPGMRVPNCLGLIAAGMALRPALWRATLAEWRKAPGFGTVHGAAFRYEGWGLPDMEPGTAEWSEAMAAMGRHEIYKRPDRVEQRLFLALDRAGIAYHALQRRGEPRAETHVWYPDMAGRLGMGGTVPEALDVIVSALTGVPAGRDKFARGL